MRTEPDHSVAQINHYFTRSREEWGRKIARGYQDGLVRDEDSFTKFDRNEVKDVRACVRVPFVEAILRHVGTPRAPGGAP
jgi:hypothetical protein